MDVFDVHERLIDDYAAFTSSLVQVRDRKIAEHLSEEKADKVRWPDPWLSLNPNFEPGGTVTELVEREVLHPWCDQFFRAKDGPDDPGSRTGGKRVSGPGSGDWLASGRPWRAS